MYNLKKRDERPNIKKLRATAGESISADEILCIAPNAAFIDMFQTYADTSALVAAWVESNTGETDAAVTVTAGEFGYGNQGMAITTTAGKDDQTITDTITADNFTSHTMYVLAKGDEKSGDFLVYLSDGTDAGSAAVTFAAKDTFEWLSFACNSTIFVKDATHGSGSDVDLTAVTGVGFAVKDSTSDPVMKVTGVVVLPSSESIEMHLADANAINRMPAVGFALYDVASAAKDDFGLFSNVLVSGQSSLIPGLFVYASATAGGVAQFFNEAVGFTRQILGIAISDTEFIPFPLGGEF